MAAGTPLTDEDRWPWLEAVALASSRQSSVVACSSLRRVYREYLLSLLPGGVFVHLDAGRQQIADRVASRAHEYMPASLMDSQLATLEPLTDAEPGFQVDATAAISELVQQAAERLAHREDALVALAEGAASRKRPWLWKGSSHISHRGSATAASSRPTAAVPHTGGRPAIGPGSEDGPAEPSPDDQDFPQGASGAPPGLQDAPLLRPRGHRG